MTKFHVYWCSMCEIKFAVDQELEDQSIVNCPICLTDKHMEDAGEAVSV